MAPRLSCPAPACAGAGSGGASSKHELRDLSQTLSNTGSSAFADDDGRICCGARQTQHDPLPPHRRRFAGRARAVDPAPTRVWRRWRKKPAPSPCAGARPALPGCAPSSAASSSRPPAPPPSAPGCSPPSIRFITTRCARRAPTSSSGSASPRPRSNRSARSARPIAKGQHRSRRGRQHGRRRRARRAHRAARRRPLVRRHLSVVLPRPCRCLSGRRSRRAGIRAHCASACASDRTPRRSARWPRPGGPGAAWRRICCGPTITP